MTNKEVILTEHVIARAIERTKLNRKKAKRVITLALERGKDVDVSQNDLRNYLKRKPQSKHIAKEYNGYCYIIEEVDGVQIGITMFPIPEKILIGSRYDGKIRIRNVKKYARFHS